MDEKTMELLSSWDLKDYISVSQEQGVDYEVLINLLSNPSDLIELVPKIGPRLKLKKRLEDHVRCSDALKRASSVDSLPSTVSLTSSAFTSTSNDTSALGSDSLIDLSDIEKDLFSPKCTNVETLTTNDENRPINDNTKPDDSSHSKILDNMNILNLKELLLESPAGKLVLSIYETQKSLDKCTRLRLVQTVIRSIIQKLPINDREVMKNHHFQILAKKIAELFASEDANTYYVPPFVENSSQKISKGKLVVRYRNELREFRKCGFFTTKKSKRDIQSDSNRSDDEELSEDRLHECSIHFDWLKHNSAPWASVEEHWKASQPLRFKDFKSEGDVSLIFERWPVLKQPAGYTLLEIDFSEMFHDQQLLMYIEWPEFRRKVQSIMQREVKGLQYQETLALANSDKVSEGTKDILTLTLLPALCPPVARVKKGKGFWRPTIVESLNGFIRHVKVPGELHTEIENRNRQMRLLQQRVQPYIIVIGPELTSIENSYVIVDATVYHVESPLKALDVCYKAFHVLRAKYPVESEQVWLLIQKCIFKMQTKWDKHISSTTALIAQIDKLA